MSRCLQYGLAGAALTALAAALVLGGCNRAAEERREAERIAGEFAHSQETDSAGWEAAEKAIAEDEGLLSPEELARSGENLPPNLTGEEEADPGEVAAAGDESGAGEPAELSDTAVAGFDGAAVYKSFRCDMCHGESREGGEYAPPIQQLTELWQRAMLERFLLDPEGFIATSPRLHELAGAYEAKMPAWSGSGEELAALIDWLLLVPEVEH